MIEKRLDADNNREIARLHLIFELSSLSFAIHANAQTENQQQNSLNEQHRISGY